jgi:hypothetical protein
MTGWESACKRDFSLLATADVSFAQLYPRSEGQGVDLVGSSIVDVVGWSNGDKAKGVAISAGRRVDNRVMFSIQLAGPTCTIGVTGHKVCIGTHGPVSVTWLLVFAERLELDAFLAFVEAKGIPVHRAEQYACAKPPAIHGVIESLLKDADGATTLLKELASSPGWQTLVDQIADLAAASGIKLAAAD